MSERAMIIVELMKKCDETDLYFILGALNAKITDFDKDIKFYAISKGYFVDRRESKDE